MFKSVLSFTARRVTFETPVPIHRILSRLDASLGRETSGLDRLHPVLKAKSKQEFVDGIQKLRPPQGGELFYFTSFRHNEWLDAYHEHQKSFRVCECYIFGNPLMARPIIERDLVAGLHIPPRLYVIEKEDKSGTQIMYLQPSSYYDVNGDQETKAIAEKIDDAFEKFVKGIISPAESGAEVAST